MTVCNLCLLVNIFVKFLEIQELVYYSLIEKQIHLLCFQHSLLQNEVTLPDIKSFKANEMVTISVNSTN